MARHDKDHAIGGVKSPIAVATEEVLTYCLFILCKGLGCELVRLVAADLSTGLPNLVLRLLIGGIIELGYEFRD